MVVTMVESDVSSQIHKVLQRLDEHDLKFSKQEKTNEGLQKMIAAQQNTIAELSTDVSGVSYPSSFP